MNAREVQDQLSLFLGLDDATISEQILPHLNSLKSRAELQDYLTGLLGNDTAQSSFVRAYAQSRFPPAPAPVKAPVASTSQVPALSTKPRVQLSSAAPAAIASTSKPQAAAQAQRPVAQRISTPPSVNVAPAVVPARGPSPLPPQSGPLRTKPPEGISTSASEALARIERNLRYAKGQGKQKTCFCQATLHPQHPLTPICMRCLLVLCDLNVPYTSSCPSCKNGTLVSPGQLRAFVVSQEVERDTVIRTEEARLRYESEEAERARRAVQFPTLDNLGHYAHTQVTSQMGYASKAGGMDHYKQIDRAYKEAQAREAAAKADAPRKVLSLNTKTKKARIQTTSLAKAKQPVVQPQKKAQTADSDLDDERKPYIDQWDDGIGKVRTESTGPVEWPPKRVDGLLYIPSGSRGEAGLEDNDD